MVKTTGAPPDYSTGEQLLDSVSGVVALRISVVLGW